MRGLQAGGAEASHRVPLLPPLPLRQALSLRVLEDGVAGRAETSLRINHLHVAVEAAEEGTAGGLA